MRRRGYVDLALKTVLFLSGVAIAVRAIDGPFHFGVSVTSPIKAEGLFGVAVLLLLHQPCDGSAANEVSAN